MNIRKRWFSYSVKTRKKILLGIMFLLILVVVPSSFAIYRGFTNVKVTTVAGEMISDVIIDSDESYIENNIPYFYVIVKNYRETDSKIILTSTSFDYTLYIENKDNSVGLYKYIDDDGNESNDYSDSLVIDNCHLDKEKDENKYKVYVTREGKLKTKVDYTVRIEADQANMED